MLLPKLEFINDYQEKYWKNSFIIFNEISYYFNQITYISEIDKFPFETIDGEKYPFFFVARRCIYFNCIMIAHRLTIDSAKGVYTISIFKNEIINNLSENSKKQYITLCKERNINSKIRLIGKIVENMRHKYLAHLSKTFITDNKCVFPITIDDLYNIKRLLVDVYDVVTPDIDKEFAILDENNNDFIKAEMKELFDKIYK